MVLDWPEGSGDYWQLTILLQLRSSFHLLLRIVLSSRHLQWSVLPSIPGLRRWPFAASNGVPSSARLELPGGC